MQEGQGIERIWSAGRLRAIIVRASLPRAGMNFVSRDEDELQLGVNHYAAGAKVRGHEHPPLARALERTLEVLHIDGGACRLWLYDDARQPIHETRLVAGDTVMFLEGGHSLEFDEATRIIEVKQGPYLGAAKDKVLY
jgi:hypothetical protein